MRPTSLTLLLLALCPASAAAAELFGVPLAGSTKGSLGMAARAAGAELRDTDRPEVWEVFGSGEVLAESRKLFLGFDATDDSFAFAEYWIRSRQHRWMLAKLKRKYGEPESVSAPKYFSDQVYRWQSDGVEISFGREFGCRCSALRYVVPAKLEIVREQHRHIQRQRAEERLDAQRPNF